MRTAPAETADPIVQVAGSDAEPAQSGTGTAARLACTVRERWGSRLLQEAGTGQRSVHRRILAAALTVAGASSVVKIASMAKEVVVARQFGAGDQIDAFVTAYALPAFVIGIAIAAFQSAVVPAYVQVRDREGIAAARALVSTLSIWTSAALLALTVLLGVASPVLLPLIGSGFDPDKLWLMRSLFFLMLPLVILTGLSATWGAALNAEGRFVLASMAPVATPLMMVLFVLWMSKSAGVYTLPAGMLVGALLEVGVLARAVSRRHLWIAPRWSGAHSAARVVMKQSIAMAAGAALMGSTTVVDHAMAAMLPPGSVATLNYGNRFVLFLLGFSAGALSTAILPQFSALVARSDWPGVRDVLRKWLGWLAIVTIPLTIVLVAASVPITRVMFERGAFVADTTLVVARVQALYLLQVPFYLMGIVLVRLVSALQSNHLLAWGAALNLGVNIAGNYVFMQWMGVSGIALSTALVYVVSCCFLAAMTYRLMKRAAEGAPQAPCT